MVMVMLKPREKQPIRLPVFFFYLVALSIGLSIELLIRLSVRVSVSLHVGVPVGLLFFCLILSACYSFFCMFIWVRLGMWLGNVVLV